MRIININYSITVTYCLTPLIKFKQSLSIFLSSEKKLWEILCTAERHLRNSSHVVQFYILYSSLKLNDAAVKASMKPENVAINIMLVRRLDREIQTLNIVFAVKLWGVFPSCRSDLSHHHHHHHPSPPRQPSYSAGCWHPLIFSVVFWPSKCCNLATALTQRARI